MSRFIILCVAVAFGCSPVFADDHTNDPAGSTIKNGAVMWRPVLLVVTALSGGFEIAIQGQTAFVPTIGATGTMSLAFVDDSWTFTLRMGPQYRFEGQYLHGGLVGLYPGFVLTTDGAIDSWMFASTVEFGYQWVFDSGFTVIVSTGPSLYIGNEVSFNWDGNIHVGIAFPDPIFPPG